MASTRKLQNIVQTARFATLEKSEDLDAVQTRIYEVAINAFTKEVLTLNRMRRVIQAVREGVDDGVIKVSGSDQSVPPNTQQGAYRGLCVAADQGLMAIGIAYSEYVRFHGHNFRASFDSAWVHEVHGLRQQIDQITLGADWTSNSAVTGQQSYWFEQLLKPVRTNVTAEELSALRWDDRFFQLCGCDAPSDTSNAKASLMLLGLLTNGTLLGIRRFQAAG